MSKVNVFDLIKTISTESVSHPEVGAVKLDVKDELPKNVQEDTQQECADENVDASVTDTKTSQPGPKDGGGDGTADFQAADKSKVHVSTKDLNIDADQNGGRHVDTLPDQVSVKDNLKTSDVSTSVEEHTGEEDTLKTIEAGGAETVGAADDLVMDIDAEVEDSMAGQILTQAETDAEVMGKILEDVGQLETAKASVESYLGILNSMERRGIEMSNELRRSISIGLESISADLFKSEIITLEEYRVSNEANGVALRGDSSSGGTLDDDTEFDGARDKTKKGLTGKLKQLWEAIKRAFHRSMNALVDLWQSFTTDTGKIADHLKDLRKRVGSLEGGKELKLANSTRLVIGDEFVGNSPEAINRVTAVGRQLLLDWPSNLVKISEAVAKGTGFFARADIGDVMGKMDDALTNTFKALKPLGAGDRAKVPSGFLDAQDLSWSGPLPGNRALYVGIHRLKGEIAAYKEMANFNSTINIKFSAVPGTDTHSGEAETLTPSAAEALSVIKALETLINQISARKEGMDALRKIAREAKMDASHDIFNKGFTDEVAYNLIFSQAVASETASGEHAFIGYLISMIKAYIGFLEGSIKTESAKEGNTFDA